MVADVGYNSDDDETQMDIIYEDQDIRTVNIKEALQKREFKSTGSNSDPAEAFELRKIRLRSRKQGAWKKQSRPQGTAMVSPKGQTIQKAVGEIHNRNRTGKKTRARVANTKAARKRDI